MNIECGVEFLCCRDVLCRIGKLLYRFCRAPSNPPARNCCHQYAEKTDANQALATALLGMLNLADVFGELQSATIDKGNSEHAVFDASNGCGETRAAARGIICNIEYSLRNGQIHFAKCDDHSSGRIDHLSHGVETCWHERIRERIALASTCWRNLLIFAQCCCDGFDSCIESVIDFVNQLAGNDGGHSN